MLSSVFTLASFSFCTSSCIFFFSFSNSVIIRTWFILVSSKACKCDSVGFILLKSYSLFTLLYEGKRRRARREEYGGGESNLVLASFPNLVLGTRLGRGQDTERKYTVPSFFRALLPFCVPILQLDSPKLKNACCSLVLLFCFVKESFILSNQLQTMSQVFILISILTCLAARASICNLFLLFRISCSNS